MIKEIVEEIKVIEEIVEEIKERDREERNRNESEETEEIKIFPIYPYLLQGLGFNDTSTLVGHFVSSPREREKSDRRDSRRD